MLGLAIFAGTAVPAHAQAVVNTNRNIAVGTSAMRGDVDSMAVVTRARLAKALPAFWASTQPGQSYMILDTMIRRGLDGSVTSNEKAGPYTFNPQTSVADVQTNAPEFVALLLGQYATQSRLALAELTAALQSYFDSTRPGQGTALNGGQSMRNSDGTATFTDGRIVFVFDEATSALTVATMAPALAAALTNYASAIETGAAAGGYAVRDPSNANQLINFDGRMYDTAGNALPNASPAAVAAAFGGGNGGRGNTASASTGSSGSTSGSNGSGSASGSGNGAGSNSGSASASNSNGSNAGTAGNNGYAANGSSGASSGSAATGSGSGTGANNSAGYATGGTTGSSGSTGGSSSAGSSGGASTGASGSNGSTGSSSGSNAGSVATGSDAASPGSSAAGGVSGTGLNGTTPLTTSGATGTANSNFGSNASSSSSTGSGGVCHVFRVLGGSGSTSCNN